MTTPALSTSGLNKRFGSLVVANEIGIALPQGVRYALIGPNGAGKTTLINLMTGMLRPDGGHILLGGEDITALGPEARVGRGLVRTFQINSLFPHLNPLEAVTLAVCEREKISRVFWRTTADYRAAVDEAYDILKSLLLAPVCTRETRELAYGQQRLLEIAVALALRPKVLLLDEPAAGVPSSESHLILDVVAALDPDIAVLIIEHDMDVVFRFAKEITVLVQGAVFTHGTPTDIMNNEQVKAVYLGQERHHEGQRGGRHG
jgi:branched-chain amino acid transport system ATP-binding protein